MTGGGAALVLFAVSLFSPRLVRPLASLAGKPIERLRGITGRLARENAMRKPGRTAVTAAALMIGVAMVVFVTVFAAGITSSVTSAIDRNFQGDVFVQNTDGFSPIPASIAAEVRRRPGCGPGVVDPLRHRRGAGRARHEPDRGRGPGRTSPMCSTLEWKDGSDDVIELARRPARPWWTTPGRSPTTWTWGTRCAPWGRPAGAARYRVVGSVKDNADFLGNFVVTQAAAAARLRRAPRHLRARRRRRRRRRRRGPGAGSRACSRRATPRPRRSTSSSSRTTRRSSSSRCSRWSTACCSWPSSCRSSGS